MRIDRVVDYDSTNNQNVAALYFATKKGEPEKGILLIVDCIYPKELFRKVKDHELDLDLEKLIPKRTSPGVITSSYYRTPRGFSRNRKNWLHGTGPEDAYISKNIKIDKILQGALIKASKDIIREIF